jgi:DNA polymerase III epsilon subunit-like protein
VLKVLGDAALIAHNAHVEVGVLQRKLGEWDVPEVFDTLKLARRLVPDQASYKLGSLVTAFDLADGLAADLKPHRATYDALMTARLFLQLAGRRPLEELRNQPPGGAPLSRNTLRFLLREPGAISWLKPVFLWRSVVFKKRVELIFDK